MQRIELNKHLQAIAAHAQGKKSAFITGNYDCNFPLTEAMVETARVGGELYHGHSDSSILLVPNDIFIDPQIDQSATRARMITATAVQKEFVILDKSNMCYSDLLSCQRQMVITERRARNRAGRDLKRALGKRTGRSHLDAQYIKETGGVYIIDGIRANSQLTGPACQFILGYLLRELEDAGFKYAAGIFVGAEFPCANEAVEHVYKVAYRGKMEVDLLYLPDPELIHHPDEFKRSKADVPLQFFSFP